MRRLLRIIGIITIAALAWLAWLENFPLADRLAREFLAREFAKHGITISLGPLYYNPLRGIVVRDAHLSETSPDGATPPVPLATSGEIVIRLDPLRILAKGDFLRSVELHDTLVTVPLRHIDGEDGRLTLSAIEGVVLLNPGHIVIKSASARIGGLLVQVHADLLNTTPPPAAPRRPLTLGQGHDALESQRPILQRVIDQLNLITPAPGAAPPVLSISVDGDLRSLSNLNADITLSGSDFLHGDFLIRDIDLAASHRSGVIRLTRGRITGHKGPTDTSPNPDGTLQLAAAFDLSTRRGQASAAGDLDILTLAAPYIHAPALRELVFYQPPAIQLTADIDLGRPQPVLLIGRLTLGRTACRSVLFDGLSVDFAWQGDRWMLDNLLIRHRSGTATGRVLQLPGNVRIQGACTLDAPAMAPVVGGNTALFLKQWEMDTPPTATIRATGSRLSLDDLDMSGEITLGPSRYRGSALQSGHTTFHTSDGAARYENFTIQCDEGRATGSVTYDFRNHRIHIDNIQTNLDLRQRAVWISPQLHTSVQPYRFHRPPQLTITGLYDDSPDHKTDLTITLRSTGPLDYTLLGEDLPLRNVNGTLHFLHQKLRLRDFSGDLYGGRITLDSDISLVPGQPGYTCDTSLDRVDFPSLTKLYFGYNSAQGRVTSRYSFTNDGLDPRRMTGSGTIRVEDGKIYDIPILGPLSPLLKGLFPDLAYNTARQMTATYTVANGAITTPDFKMTGNGFSLVGGGKLYFMDDSMDFSLRLNGEGLHSLLVNPVGMLFEYQTDGPLSAPVWRPKNFSPPPPPKATAVPPAKRSPNRR